MTRQHKLKRLNLHPLSVEKNAREHEKKINNFVTFLSHLSKNIIVPSEEIINETHETNSK